MEDTYTFPDIDNDNEPTFNIFSRPIDGFVDDYDIPEECLIPCICKAVDAPQTFFTQNEF